MLVYYGQTVGWISMPFGMEVGLGPATVSYMGTHLPHGKGHSSLPTLAVYVRSQACVCVRKPPYFYFPFRRKHWSGVICRCFWATVCKTVRPVLSDRCLSVCLSVLSVTFVYCGQTVGWIKIKLDTR